MKSSEAMNVGVLSARRLKRLSPLVVGVFAACVDRDLPPNGQILITVTTDAPLPPPAGEVLGPDDPLPLFDRLRIEVFRPGETMPCAECVNEFDVDRDLVRAGRASFGVTPPVGVSGYVARVRL